MYKLYFFLAAAAAAASSGSLHTPSSSASLSSLPSTILGSPRVSSLLSPLSVGKEEKVGAGISSAGISAAATSSSHGVHSHPPVGAVGPMPHIGNTYSRKL